MTPKDLTTIIAEELGAPPEVTYGFVQATVSAIVRLLNQGEEVKVRGLGTFRWVPVGPRSIPLQGKLSKKPHGWKLKFIPALQFRTRRLAMCDEDMTKYGVQTDQTKLAGKNKKAGHCPVCGKQLDSGGACPLHGTEPFEHGDT